MYKGYYILFLLVILIGCGSEPTGVDEAPMDSDLPSFAPPLGDSQLDGLCSCNLSNRRDYLADAIGNNCNSHETIKRDSIEKALEACVKAVNDQINDRLEALCSQVDSICALGSYYDRLQAAAWTEYHQRVNYLGHLSNSANYMLIYYLIQREKKRLNEVSDYYDRLIGRLADQLRSIHATFTDVYNSQRGLIYNCVDQAKALAASLGVNCLEFSVTFIQHQE